MAYCDCISLLKSMSLNWLDKVFLGNIFRFLTWRQKRHSSLNSMASRRYVVSTSRLENSSSAALYHEIVALPKNPRGVTKNPRGNTESQSKECHPSSFSQEIFRFRQNSVPTGGSRDGNSNKNYLVHRDKMQLPTYRSYLLEPSTCFHFMQELLPEILIWITATWEIQT